MQELRLVAVSEDGSYLVLATAGRGTRFTLPVDDRLRAAVRGHFSRLGQFEIEVESPLRPKEIQARIRAGETAEEIAESAGIPVERVRWFEGPVLQEREYMAQQAQRVVARRQGETSPGPPLGEIVEDRLGRRGVDLEEVEWDSWKCEDSTWRVRLSFFVDGRPGAAEWVFDPRRRHVSPLDEEAARLSSLELDSSVADRVTPLVPRRPAMKVVSDSAAADSPGAGSSDAGSLNTGSAPRHQDEVAPTAYEGRPAHGDEEREPASAAAPSGTGRDGDDDLEEIVTATRAPDRRTARRQTKAREEEQEEKERKERASKQSKQRPEQRPEHRRQPEPPAAPEEQVAADRTGQDVPEQVAAAANGGTPSSPASVAPAAKATSGQPARGRRKGSGRGKRASVPSWDEIMFGSRRPE
jgi:hypothetical protein